MRKNKFESAKAMSGGVTTTDLKLKQVKLVWSWTTDQLNNFISDDRSDRLPVGTNFGFEVSAFKDPYQDLFVEILMAENISASPWKLKLLIQPMYRMLDLSGMDNETYFKEGCRIKLPLEKQILKTQKLLEFELTLCMYKPLDQGPILYNFNTD